MRSIIKTKGMHCKSCEGLLKEVLEEVDGIKDIDVSCKTGIIEVVHEIKVKEKDIVEIIKLQGYEVL